MRDPLLRDDEYLEHQRELDRWRGLDEIDNLLTRFDKELEARDRFDEMASPREIQGPRRIA